MDTITVIDFGVKTEQIENLKDMPEQAQQCALAVERMESRGWQEVLGFNDRQIIFSMGGGWDGDKFHCTSMYKLNFGLERRDHGESTKLFVE